MKLILGRSVTVALMSTPLAAQAQFFGSFDNNTVVGGAAIAGRARRACPLRRGNLNIGFRLYSLSVGLRGDTAC